METDIDNIYNNIKKRNCKELNISSSRLHKKFPSLLILVILSIITFTIFFITNDSYSLESQNSTNNYFNIIAVADVGCSLRAQENIKNIEKLQPELFLVGGDLSYEKTPDCWFDTTKPNH